MNARAPDLRARIVEAAADLLARGGREAVSTRAVSAEAGVQAPAIYRQFADMDELLRTAARELLARYVREKASHAPARDPVDDLRRGWDGHVAFGLANAAAYEILYGAAGAEGEGSEGRAGVAMLVARLARVAEAGRLRVTIPVAAAMMRAGATGATLALLGTPETERDLGLSLAMREAVLVAITAPAAAAREATKAASGDKLATHAVALRTMLADTKHEAFSTAERHLLGEWLDRLAGQPTSPAPSKRRQG